jgi:hypothetical protein
MPEQILGINQAKLPLLNEQIPIPDFSCYLSACTFWCAIICFPRRVVSAIVKLSQRLPRRKNHYSTPALKTFTNEESTMKIKCTLALLLFLPVCYAEENAGKYQL